MNNFTYRSFLTSFALSLCLVANVYAKNLILSEEDALALAEKLGGDEGLEIMIKEDQAESKRVQSKASIGSYSGPSLTLEDRVNDGRYLGSRFVRYVCKTELEEYESYKARCQTDLSNKYDPLFMALMSNLSLIFDDISITQCDLKNIRYSIPQAKLKALNEEEQAYFKAKSQAKCDSKGYFTPLPLLTTIGGVLMATSFDVNTTGVYHSG